MLFSSRQSVRRGPRRPAGGAAGFAADAYARMQGFGVVCATYMVGGLKLLNTTAQAYAERSPVLVIAGAPGYR